VKPFLLLSTRAEELAAEEEYAAFLREAGLAPHELRRWRMTEAPLPSLELDDYAGVMLGGGPFDSSDPAEAKSATQHRVERELAGLLDVLVAEDRPFLGACYGIGTLGVHQGGVVDRTHSEPIGAVEVELTDDGVADPLLAGLPARFDAYVGHKEACRVLPPTATLLARSARCPVQMFRVRSNLYATQFHPELDEAGLVSRIRIYRNAGYFPPEQVEDIVGGVAGSEVRAPTRILANFAARYS
jgi:GMP synthase (glutamine-hydrolysing)